jgi:hypothetical protein
MIAFLRHLIGWIITIFRSRQDLILENLALRQQLLVLHTKRPRRRLPTIHKLFWIGLRRLWSRWNESLILVTPRTVVTWHRAGFRLYWKWLSRARHVGGRKPVSEEVRMLIFRMATENPTWGAPRIHGELLKLGFDVSEPTVSRWLRRVPRATDPGQRWLTFLRNHRTAIAAMTHLWMRVGLYLHPRGMLAIQSLRLPPPFRGLGSVLPYRSRDVGSTDWTSDLPADCCAGCPICKSSAAIFIPTPGVFGSHSRKAAIMSSLNPLHARGLCGNSAHSTYRTT